MYGFYKSEVMTSERCNDLVREAEHEALVLEALKGRKQGNRFGKAIASLGNLIFARGLKSAEKMQRRASVRGGMPLMQGQ